MLKFQVLGQGFRLYCFQVTGLEVGVEAPANIKRHSTTLPLKNVEMGGCRGGAFKSKK